jgi:gas vesicle protein
MLITQKNRNKINNKNKMIDKEIKHKNRTKGFLVSFLLGGAIGSAIALLYAPKSGKKLRSDIAKKSNELLEEGKRKTSDSWNGVKKIAGDTFESANEALNIGRDKVMNKSERITDAFKSAFNPRNDDEKSGSYQSNSLTEDNESKNIRKQKHS